MEIEGAELYPRVTKSMFKKYLYKSVTVVGKTLNFSGTRLTLELGPSSLNIILLKS